MSLKEISNEMIGWMGAGGRGLDILSGVCKKISGNYLEIGSLWGASALVAGLSNHDIELFCVDPYDYQLQEPCSRKAGNITKSINDNIPVAFKKNMKHFGISERVTLVQKKSYPIPEEISSIEFELIYIDGYHYGNTPLLDTKYSAEASTRFILLDDVYPYYPSVVRAFSWLLKHENWLLYRYHYNDGLAVFVRLEEPYGNIWNFTSEPCVANIPDWAAE